MRTLVSERFEPGDYEVQWDGLDDRGASLAQGNYFLKLITDDVTDSVQIIEDDVTETTETTETMGIIED